MKKLISVLITVSLLLTFMPATFAAEENGMFSAFLTIENKVEFTWTADADAKLSIYGTDYPDSGEKFAVVENMHADCGSHIFDFIAEEKTYHNYYIFELTKGGAKETKIVETGFYMPRVSKEITNLNHPYLMATEKDVERVKALVAAGDAVYKKNYDNLIKNAERYINLYGETEAVTQSEADNVCDVMPNIGAAYVISGDKRYLDIGLHCLMLLVDYIYENTSVATEAKNDYWYIEEVAIGYDFLYNGINEVDRQVIENGLFREWTKRLDALPRGQMSNQGGVNHVLPTIGLLLKDHDMIVRGLFRENYGLYYSFLNALNDDGSMWNQPPMYFSGIVGYWYRLAQMFYNCGYDMFNEKVSGTRTTREYWENVLNQSSSTNYREEELGDIIEVEDKQVFKSLLNYIFYFAYSDRSYPNLADTDASFNYGLRTGVLSTDIFETAFKHFKDPRVQWFLEETKGANREKGSFGHYYEMFYAEPVVGDGDFYIGNGYFDKSGYNKLGNSMFNDYGQAILRSQGSGSEVTNIGLYWKRFIETHGHSDALNLTMFANGQMALYDPGSYTYGSDVHNQYARRAIGHNTVVIDETDHWPSKGDSLYDSLSPEKQESTRGFLDNAAIGPVTRVVKAYTDRAYSADRNGIDSSLQRTVWQIDDYAIDVFNATSDDENHTYDYLLNISGELLSSTLILNKEADESAALGSKNGYQYVQKLAKSEETEKLWSNTYTLSKGGKLNITMTGDEGTQAITAKASNAAYSYENEKLIVRKNTDKDAVFITVLDPAADGEQFREVTELPVTIKGKKIDWADAVKISRDGVDDTFIYGESYGTKKAGKLYSDAETAFYRENNGEDTVLGMVNGKYISGEDIALDFTSNTAMQFTKLHNNCYRLDMGQGTQRNTAVRISGLGSGYDVYEMALSDEMILTPVAQNSTSFSVKTEGIYIIAKDGAEANMSAPLRVTLDSSADDYAGMSTVSDINEAPSNGIIIEAEDIAKESGGQVAYISAEDSHTTQNPNGTGIYKWDNAKHTLSWNVTVPKAGKYRVLFRYSTKSDSGAEREFIVNDGEAVKIHFDSTGEWTYNRHIGEVLDSEGNEQTFEFKEGLNTVTMVNAGSSLNFDYIMLVPVQ